MNGATEDVVHVFGFPSRSDRGSYRMIQTLSSFTDGPPPKRNKILDPYLKRYRSPSWRADRLFYQRHRSFEDFITDQEIQYTRYERRGLMPYDQRVLNLIRHQDLWAFFDYVGWDHQRRVWIK